MYIDLNYRMYYDYIVFIQSIYDVIKNQPRMLKRIKQLYNVYNDTTY